MSDIGRGSNDDDDLTITTNTNGNGNSSLGVRVLSASGDNIIAVTNPALAMSPTLVEPLNIKREHITIDD